MSATFLCVGAKAWMVQRSLVAGLLVLSSVQHGRFAPASVWVVRQLDCVCVRVCVCVAAKLLASHTGPRQLCRPGTEPSL